MRLMILISLIGCTLAAPGLIQARIPENLGISGSFGQRLENPSLGLGGFGNALDFEGQQLVDPVNIRDLNVGDGFQLDQGFNVPESSLGGINALGLGSQGFIAPNEILSDPDNALGLTNHEIFNQALSSGIGNQGIISPFVSRGISDEFQIHEGSISGGLGSNFGTGLNQRYAVPESFQGISNDLGIGIDQRYAVPQVSGLSSNLGIGGLQKYIAPDAFSGGISNSLRGKAGQGYSPPGSSSRGNSNSFGLGKLDFRQERGHSAGLSSQTYGPPKKGGYQKKCRLNEILHVDGSCVQPDVFRNLFVYRAPKLPKPYIPRPHVPKPKVLYNVVFVRTPESAQAPDPIVVPPPQQKTVVYVLTKNGQVGQKVIEVATGPDQEPDVFYVNYNEGENPVLPGGISLKEALASAISQDGSLVGGYGNASNDIRQDNRGYGPETGRNISPYGSGTGGGGFSGQLDYDE